MGEIDWSMEAAAIERLIRGLNPWPSAYTCLRGQDAEAVGGGGVLDERSGGQDEPGRDPSQWKETALLVETGKRPACGLRQLQLEGKKRMGYVLLFLRGFPVPEGTVLG